MNPDALYAIASSGGGIIIDAKKTSPAVLKAIASNLRGNGAKLTVRNAFGIVPAVMQEIASIAPGQVEFDITNMA